MICILQFVFFLFDSYRPVTTSLRLVIGGWSWVGEGADDGDLWRVDKDADDDDGDDNDDDNDEEKEACDDDQLLYLGQ